LSTPTAEHRRFSPCTKSEASPRLTNGEWLAIDVADDGAGIAIEHQPELFDDFTPPDRKNRSPTCDCYD